jgi:hypothetical protein
MPKRTKEQKEELDSKVLRDDASVSFEGTPDESYDGVKDAEEKAKDTGFNPEILAETLVEIGQKMMGYELYQYQKDTSFRILYSLLVNDGAEVTMLFARQSGKCFAKGTQIMMYDGTTKSVEDVVQGDILMGPEGDPRTVLGTTQGREEMFKIKPRTKYGKEYTVNKSHILAFKERKRDGSGYEKRFLSVEDYLREPEYKRRDMFVGYRSAIDVGNEIDGVVDPYFLGLWLGDGNSRDLQITTVDDNIIEWLEEYARSLDANLSIYKSHGNINSYCITYTRRNEKKGQKFVPNAVVDEFREMDLFRNKHIPTKYFLADRKTRLKLLAGIVDSDGYKSKSNGKENIITATFKDERLALDLQKLARSLGFRATVYERMARIKDIGYECLVYRVSIYGNTAEIPSLLIRKQTHSNELRQNPLHYGFDVESVGEGDYYGFKVDKDSLFLLDDFTVCHNSEIVAFVVVVIGTLFPVLARIFPKEMGYFKNGVKMGLIAPQLDQVETVYSRCMERIWSDRTRIFLTDPDIDDAPLSKVNFKLKNGSFLKAQSGAKQSKIESKTYHIVFIDEAQDMDREKVRKSIIPMTASTFGTIVRLGTPNRHTGDFFQMIEKNKKDDYRVRGKNFRLNRKHFQYDYKSVIKDKRSQHKKDGARFHTLYEKSIKRDIDSIGEHSEEFRMAYKLEWLHDIGMFITIENLEAYCYDKRIMFPPQEKDMYNVAGLDIASARNSTVCTIGRVNSPVEEFGERPRKIITGWLELEKTNYDEQLPIICEYLVDNKVAVLYADYTGVGRAMVDLIGYYLGEYVEIVPYTFNPATKSDMYKRLDEDITNRRVIVPAHPTIRKMTEFKRFEQQMINLNKYWKGSTLICEKGQGFNDDYCDSLALMNMAGNHMYARPSVAEASENIFSPMNSRRDLIKKSRW